MPHPLSAPLGPCVAELPGGGFCGRETRSDRWGEFYCAGLDPDGPKARASTHAELRRAQVRNARKRAASASPERGEDAPPALYRTPEFEPKRARRAPPPPPEPDTAGYDLEVAADREAARLLLARITELAERCEARARAAKGERAGLARGAADTAAAAALALRAGLGCMRPPKEPGQ
jgi:hypothetical protein